MMKRSRISHRPLQMPYLERWMKQTQKIRYITGYRQEHFENVKNADRLLYHLLDRGYPAYILWDGDLFKVQVGAYQQLGNAIPYGTAAEGGWL